MVAQPSANRLLAVCRQALAGDETGMALSTKWTLRRKFCEHLAARGWNAIQSRFSQPRRRIAHCICLFRRHLSEPFKRSTRRQAGAKKNRRVGARKKKNICRSSRQTPWPARRDRWLIVRLDAKNRVVENRSIRPQGKRASLTAHRREADKSAAPRRPDKNPKMEQAGVERPPRYCCRDPMDRPWPGPDHLVDPALMA